MDVDENNHIHTTVKIRALNQQERSNNEISCWSFNSNVNCIFQVDKNGRSMPESSFSFDSVLGENAGDLELFETICPPLISSFLSGINSGLIAYGLTSSGMTSSLYGIHENSGIIQLIIQSLLNACNELTNAQLSLSFIEVYKENPIDLFNPKKVLTIHENAQKGIYLEATRLSFTSLEEFTTILQKGKSNRHISSTHMNPYSSRSHTILYIYLQQTTNNHAFESVMRIVDMAGAQHIRNTGISGSQLEEAKKINFGLSAFTRVIRSFQTNKESVSYMGFRDSKFTRLLQPCFNGSTHTSFLVCMTPASSYIRETISTLQVGQQVQHIHIHPSIHSGYSEKSIIQRLQGEVMYLRKQMQNKNRHNDLSSISVNSVFTRVTDCRESTFDMQSETPTICGEFELSDMEKENELLRDQIAEQNQEIIQTRMLMKKYEEEVNDKQELLELIERLRKENAELRQLIELYSANSKTQEKECSTLLREVNSLRNELSDCEQAAAHFSVCISEMENFLSPSYSVCLKENKSCCIKIQKEDHQQDQFYLTHEL